ncbi:MAG: hypothetical protein Q8L46_02495, partial [candidate division WWE3 bacterium]|nr:hypothetical protein [candidate division WWE3 bacterium]
NTGTTSTNVGGYFSASGATNNYAAIFENGNVGIGTTAPTNILSLGNTAAQKFWIENTASGTVGRALTVAAGGTVAGGTNITGGNLILQSGLGTGTGASTISFQTGTTLGTGTTLQTMETKMTILGNGNVGIGITDPGNMKLRVEGNTRAAAYYDTGDLTDTYFLNPAGSSSFGGSLTLVGQLTFNGTLQANSNTINLLSSASTAVCVGDATCAGKLDAGTIDPPYTINGKKYATYLSAMTGIKEETTGTVTTKEYLPGVGFRSIINFNNQPEGSDLWIFSKTSDLRKNIAKLIPLLTPQDNTRTWYSIDKNALTLTIYSSEPTTVAYRLTAPRFDSDKWSNERDSDHTGFIINNPDNLSLALNPRGDIIVPTIKSDKDYVYD